MKKRSFHRLLGALLCAALLFSLSGCRSGAVRNTEKLISAIGRVTADSADAVEAAEAAYAALSEADRARVEGADVLETARTELDRALRVKHVSDLIDAIDEHLTPESREAVETAEAALAALPEEEKALVPNVTALADAREALDEACRRAVLGVWAAETDAARYIIESVAASLNIDPEAAAELVGGFKLHFSMELREDGAYLIRLDKVRLKGNMTAVFDKLRPAFEDMLVQALGEGLARAGVAGDLTTREGIETALGMPLDDVFKSVAGITMDEMIDAMTEIVSGKTDELADVVQGRFRLDIDKNELAFSRQSEDEADPADGERFRLAGDTLEIYEPVGEPFFEDMYPVVFTREP